MADPIFNTPIPDTPPAKSGATPDAVRGIKAIKQACNDGGLTSKYAICALLGIIGVESKWVPVEENHKYSAKNLATKPRVTAADVEKYANGKVSKKEFFGWFYGTRNGKAPAVGQYYGRGFIELTWKENYAVLGKKTGYDLVNNPDLMVGTDDTTMLICAKVAVEFIKMRIPDWNSEQWKPGFVFKCLHAVNPGDPTGSKSHTLKLSYYEYFLGGKAAEAPTDKDAANSALGKSQAEINSASPVKKEAYTEDRTSNFDKFGFSDPEGKYPLRDYMNEPDTNRLARGIIDGTHVKFKDSVRKYNIPTANGGYYDQPQSAYSAIYPYNKVFESESGHIVEFDDSPDGERINVFHRKGTYYEVDPNGTQTNYVVGDSFVIVERNGNIYINGTCNLTCSGPMNILCQGDANLEVKGQADCTFHNDVNLGVALDLNVAVGGDFNVLVEGNYNIEVGKTMNQRVVGTLSLESTDALKLKTAKTMSLEGGDTQTTAETLMKLSSNIKIETSEAYQIKAKSFKLDIEDGIELKGGSVTVESTADDVSIKSNSNIKTLSSNNTLMTGATVELNPDIPVSIDSISTLDNLGTLTKPITFGGDIIEDRAEENVLVDTVLNPAGEYNPNTLPKSVIDSVLGDIPLAADILSLFGGSAPDVYDIKYSGPIETKTSLATVGKASTHRLVVPVAEAAYNQPFGNLVPPPRHTDGVYKYETEDDWNSVQGQRTRNNLTSTSDYEHNGGIPGKPEESAMVTGGKGAGKPVSQDKLNDIKGRTDFPSTYKLSEHFTLGMLVHQQGHILQDTVLPAGKSEANGTTTRLYTKQEIVANMCALAENILEPIYDLLGPCKQMGTSGANWNITSGLRNDKNGSDHNKGRAIDFQLWPTRNINDQFDLIVKLEKILAYNQLIFEYRNNGTSNWIHVSYSTQGNQGRAFTMIDDKTVNSSGKNAPGSTGFYKFYT